MERIGMFDRNNLSTITYCHPYPASSNYSIISVLAIPGSLIACWMVDWTRKGRVSFGGRKFAMALSTTLTGVFLFLFTTAKNQAGVLAYSCVTSLTQCAETFLLRCVY
jgi:sugar phosphate permease